MSGTRVPNSEIFNGDPINFHENKTEENAAEANQAMIDADEHFVKKNYDHASGLYTTAIELYENNPSELFFFNLGLCYKGIADCQSVLASEVDVKTQEDAKLKQKKLKQAREHYKESLRHFKSTRTDIRLLKTSIRDMEALAEENKDKTALLNGIDLPLLKQSMLAKIDQIELASPRQQVEINLKLSRIYASLNKFEDELHYLKKAFDANESLIKLKPKDGDIKHESLKLQQKMADLNEKISRNHEAMADNKENDSRAKEYYQKSLTYAKEAYRLARILAASHDIHMKQAYYARKLDFLAGRYELLGDYDSAYNYYSRAMNIYKMLSIKSEIDVHIVLMKNLNILRILKKQASILNNRIHQKKVPPKDAQGNIHDLAKKKHNIETKKLPTPTPSSPDVRPSTLEQERQPLTPPAQRKNDNSPHWLPQGRFSPLRAHSRYRSPHDSEYVGLPSPPLSPVIRDNSNSSNQSQSSPCSSPKR